MGTPAEGQTSTKDEKDPETMAKIRKQIDYYFCDSNLPRDKFLLAKVEEDPNGYVDLDLFQTFNRIKAMNVTTEDIATAVQDSKIVQVDESKKRVRRIEALPEKFKWKHRAIRVRGWTPNGEEPSIEEVQKMFEPHGKVLSVKIRRYQHEDGSRKFRGSAFVEFENEEAAERACADTHTINVEVKDDNGQSKMVEKELDVLSIENWRQAKQKEVQERKERFLIRKREKMIAEGRDPDAEKKNKGKLNSGKEYTKRLVLKFDNVGPEVAREDIREILEVYGPIAWIEFQRGDEEGYLRFSEVGTAEKVLEAFKGDTIRLGGKKPTGHLLEGEKEREYWEEVSKEKQTRKAAMKRKYSSWNKGPKRKRARVSPPNNGEGVFQEEKGGVTINLNSKPKKQAPPSDATLQQEKGGEPTK